MGIEQPDPIGHILHLVLPRDRPLCDSIQQEVQQALLKERTWLQFSRGRIPHSIARIPAVWLSPISVASQIPEKDRTKACWF